MVRTHSRTTLLQGWRLHIARNVVPLSVTRCGVCRTVTDVRSAMNFPSRTHICNGVTAALRAPLNLLTLGSRLGHTLTSITGFGWNLDPENVGRSIETADYIEFAFGGLCVDQLHRGTVAQRC